MRNFGLKRGKYNSLIGRQAREKYPELKKLFERIDNYQNEVEKQKDYERTISGARAKSLAAP